jgi:hypothetical protein
METLTKANIRRGRTEIDVPCQDRYITFVYPSKGPGRYLNVMNQISVDGLLRPISAQIISLVYSAQQAEDEPEFNDILTKLKNNYLWSATENLSIPKIGIIVYDNIDGKMPQTSKELLELSEAKDPRVRLVPYGFKTGSQSISDFIKNPYVIAQFGEEQMDLVARVAKGFKNRPWVDAILDPSRLTKKYTALDSDWGDCRLYVYGDCDDDFDDGFVFGVCNTGEASCTQK